MAGSGSVESTKPMVLSSSMKGENSTSKPHTDLPNRSLCDSEVLLGFVNGSTAMSGQDVANVSLEPSLGHHNDHKISSFDLNNSSKGKESQIGACASFSKLQNEYFQHTDGASQLFNSFAGHYSAPFTGFQGSQPVVHSKIHYSDSPLILAPILIPTYLGSTPLELACTHRLIATTLTHYPHISALNPRSQVHSHKLHSTLKIKPITKCHKQPHLQLTPHKHQLIHFSFI